MNVKSVSSFAALVVALILGTSLSLQSGAASATPVSESKVNRPTLFVVEASADWCSTCKVIAADLKKTKADFADASVIYFQMDLTDQATKANSRKLAKLLGLNPSIVDVDQRSQVFIVDGQTNKIMETIRGKQSPDVYAQAIQKHLDGLKVSML
ncbi:MAG: thioredoxin domain-containing protein [Opitutales bacterium]